MKGEALQLVLKNFNQLSSSGTSSIVAGPRKFGTLSLVSLRVCSMTSKRLLSNSSSPPKPTTGESKNRKKSKVSKEASLDSEKTVVKESHLKIHSAEIQGIKDDPGKIEAMTVQELKNMLRNVGVPAKGRKMELVSALKSFVDEQLTGEGSWEVEERAASISGENISMQKKDKKVSNESYILCNDTVGRRRRTKQSLAEDETVKVDTKFVPTNEKVSIKSDEVSVGKPSRARRKVNSSANNGDAKADHVLSFPLAEPWTLLAHKKPQEGWIPYNPRIMRPLPPTGDTKFVKLMSWNVNGLRALLNSEAFSAPELAQRENFDVLCLQETKLQEKDVESITQCLMDGYEHCFWTCSLSKLGYSGTAIISRIKPLSVSYGLGLVDHDSEGRVVTAEFDSFYLLSVYVPNSGEGLRRLSYRITEWDPSLSNYMKELEKSKPVILTGDLNCAHQEMDIYNPEGNRRSAGFTAEERESFATNLLSRGFVDTFRRQHPNVVGYTYWGYRHGARKTNKGWRLDYFLTSESIADDVHDSYIIPDVLGSDHCPIGLILKL